jgi:UDP-N-acetylglucosamine acyltransferase
VSLDAGCVIGPGVHITGATRIGKGNRFHAGCVIGDAPQDLRYAGEPTRLMIGDHNVFREHTTLHRSNAMKEDTVIGSHNYFMANSHVGHNTTIGNHVILANGALVAGHVTMADRAFISGNCLIHQFVRIGSLALMQGGSAISKDLPPFTIARGHNATCGLNVIGLRRAGFSAEERLELKRAYRLLQRGREPLPLRRRLELIESQCKGVCVQALLEFVRQSRRGICADCSTSDGSVSTGDDLDYA